MDDKIIDALNWRFAVKEFEPSKKVAPADLETILESGRLAPSSMGFEPWKILVVENPEVRAKLRAVSYGQSKVTDAAHILVIAGRTDLRQNGVRERLERTAKAQNMQVEELSGLKAALEGTLAGIPDDATLNEWAAAQTYIPLGIMVETASLLGVDNCPMGGFDRAAVDELLGLGAKNLASVSMLALGYRGNDATAAMPKVRRDAADAIEFIR